MQKIIIAVVVILAAGIAGAGGWWSYTHFLRDPVTTAHEMLARGELRPAQLVLRNALLKDPGNARLHYELGQLAVRVGDMVSAEKELKAARAGGAAQADVAPLLARAYLGQGKFRDLLKEFPPSGLPPAAAANLLVSRSMSQLALGDAPSARASAMTAERLAPTLAEAPLAMARIAANTGDRGQAMLKVNAALALDPKSIEALGLKADLQRGEGELAAAVTTLDTAIATAPTLAPVRLARARVLLLLGDETRARQDVDMALKLESENPTALYLLAILQIRARDWQAANVSMQRLQPVLTRVPRGEYYYALVKSNVNQLEQAAEAIGHYVARSKNDADGYRLLARIKLLMGQPAEANEALRHADDLGGDRAQVPAGVVLPQASPDEASSDTPESLTRLATHQLEEGDSSGAARELEQSLEIQPTRADSSAAQVLEALAIGDVDRAQAALDRLARQPRALPEVVGNLTGLVRMAQLDIDGARTAWEDTIKAQPEAVPPRVNLARVLALRGDNVGALKLLGEILDIQPANRAALRTAVELLAPTGKIDQAIALVQKARKVVPNTLGMLSTEAILQARKGDFTAAYNLIDGVPLGQANSPLLLNTRAQLQLAQDRKQDAADTYRQLLLGNPRDLAARRRLIDLLLALDKAEGAQKLVDEGLAQAPGDSNLLQLAVGLTYRLKGIDAALAQVEQLLQDPINLPSARLLRGGIYMVAKRYDDAVAAYAAEMKDQPFTALALGQAAALRAAGRGDDATLLLRDWVGKQPDPVVAEGLASLDIEQHHLDLAEQNLLGVLSVRPNDAIALNNLAWIYAQRNDKRARTMAQKAYLLAPSPQTGDTLGWILLHDNVQPEFGLSLLRRSAQQLPRDATVQYHLAAGLAQLGHGVEAIPVLTDLLAKHPSFDDRAAAETLLRQTQASLPPPPAATPVSATATAPATAATLGAVPAQAGKPAGKPAKPAPAKTP